MDFAPFNAPVSAKRRTKVIKIRDGTEVAARHFVYKLYDTTDGHRCSGGFCMRPRSTGRSQSARASWEPPATLR
jgi:hypothetical protein